MEKILKDHKHVEQLSAELDLPVAARLDEGGHWFREQLRGKAKSDMDWFFSKTMDALAICMAELIKLKYEN